MELFNLVHFRASDKLFSKDVKAEVQDILIQPR